MHVRVGVGVCEGVVAPTSPESILLAIIGTPRVRGLAGPPQKQQRIAKCTPPKRSTVYSSTNRLSHLRHTSAQGTVSWFIDRSRRPLSQSSRRVDSRNAFRLPGTYILPHYVSCEQSQPQQHRTHLVLGSASVCRTGDAERVGPHSPLHRNFAGSTDLYGTEQRRVGRACAQQHKTGIQSGMVARWRPCQGKKKSSSPLLSPPLGEDKRQLRVPFVPSSSVLVELSPPEALSPPPISTKNHVELSRVWHAAGLRMFPDLE